MKPNPFARGFLVALPISVALWAMIVGAVVHLVG